MYHRHHYVCQHCQAPLVFLPEKERGYWFIRCLEDTCGARNIIAQEPLPMFEPEPLDTLQFDGYIIL